MGFGEILVILLIALLVFGPERLPTMIKEAASFIRDLRTMVARARSDLGSTVGDLGLDKEDLELLADLRNPKSFIRQKVLDGADLGLDDPELAEALSLDDKPARKPKSARKTAVGSSRSTPRAGTGGTSTTSSSASTTSTTSAKSTMSVTNGHGPEPKGTAPTEPVTDSFVELAAAAPPPFDPDAT